MFNIFDSLGFLCSCGVLDRIEEVLFKVKEDILLIVFEIFLFKFLERFVLVDVNYLDKVLLFVVVFV